MKLLFYIGTLGKGGAERVVTVLSGKFAASGHEVLIATNFYHHNEYNIPAGVRRISFAEHRLDGSVLHRNWVLISSLRKLIKKEQPEVVISFMSEQNMRAILATRCLPVKVIVSERTDPNRSFGGRRRFLGQHIMPLADGCVFQTYDAQAWFPQKLQRKSTVILNPVGERFFEKKYQGNNPYEIVAVGRLERVKNHQMLIEAVAELKSEFPKVQLKIYGEGSLSGHLDDLIRKQDLSQYVHLMGLSKHIDEVLAEAGIFVLCSDYEGMPNALLEAMAIGVPCISTDCPCGGPRMVIRDMENGLLTRVGDKESLINAFRSMLNDRGQAMVMGQNARQTAQRFKLEIIYEQWREYFDAVLKRSY